MIICPVCKKEVPETANFCTYCGASLAAAPVAENQPPVQPQYTQPVQTQYIQPQYQQPQPAAPNKAFTIVGMALSIAGFATAIIGFFYILMFLMVEFGSMAFGMAIGFGMFSFPLSLVGLIMSNKARNAGVFNVFTKLGKIFGVIGVAISGANLFFGIVGLGSGDANSYYDGYYY